MANLGADTLDHPADARLGVMLAVDLVKDIAHLFLRQPFGVEDTGKPVAFFLLVAKDGQDTGMEVPVAVAGNADLKFFPVAVCVPGTASVPFIPLVLS